MPRVKESEKVLSVVANLPQFLEDGHPNPDAYNVWEFMQTLTEDQWQDYIGYLYRTAPKHAPTDRDAFLATVVKAITLEDVKQLYGGKKFTLWLNRRNKGGGGKGKSVFKAQFDIEADPKWQATEMPESSEAKAAGQPGAPGAASSVLTDKFVTDLMEQRDKAQNQDPGGAFDKAVEIVNKGATAAIDVLKDQAKSGAGGNNEILVTLVNKLLDRLDQKPASNGIMDKMLERMIDKMISPVDPAAEITKWLQVADTLRGAGGGGSGRGGKTDLMDVAMEFARNNPGILTEAIQTVRDMVAIRRGLPTASTPGIAGQRPAALPAAAAPQHPLGTVQPGPTNPQPPAPNPGEPVQISQEVAQEIVAGTVKARIVEMLFAGDDGGDAALMATKMYAPVAQWLYETLKAGKYMELQSDPILKGAATHPNVIDFAKEYVAYFDEQPSDDNGSGEQPPAPAPKAVN